MELSANQYCCPPDYTLGRFLDEARAAGFTRVALTRQALAGHTPEAVRRQVAARDLTVTTLNSAGYFTWSDPGRRAAQADENRALVDAAAEIGAGALCVITGGSAEQPDLATARARIAEGLGELDAVAARAGVRLGLEPIHPRDVPTKGCVNTVAQALDLTAGLAATGLILDLFHSWWDPGLIAAAAHPGTRIVQICNVLPEPRRSADPGRGMLDLRAIAGAMTGAGYAGPFEFEVFAADHGLADIAPLLRTAMDWARG